MIKIRKIKNKKAQGWGMDLIIGVTIFTLGLIVFFIYSLNSPGEAKKKIAALSYEGRILTNTILSEGSPAGWNANEVIKIGILSDNKINETKLKYFYDLTKVEEDYEETKNLLNIDYDYYFYLNEDMDFGSLILKGIGKPDFNKEEISPDIKNLIKITRYTIYQNKPMTAYFYIWDEG